MRKTIIRSILALTTVFAASSCLDFEPKAQMGDGMVWNKASNFELYANQFYGWTRDFQGSTSVTYMNGYYDGPHADVRSDLMTDKATANVFSQGTNTIPTTDKNYSELYKRIYYVNLLLKNAKTFPNQEEIAVPVGEALFFRAYLYFELVQLFGDCVLLQEPVDIDSEKLYGKRDDRLDVINACVKDLKDAAGLLKDTPAADGRICSYTAWAFLSRVALYEGTWQKYHKKNIEAANGLLKEASEAAKKVMDSKKYELFSSDKLGGRDSYRYLFTLENTDCNPAKLQKAANKEYIFARRHDETVKPINLDITHGAYNNAYVPTKKLADMYRCQDGLPISISPKFKGYGSKTEFQDRDNRMNGTLMIHDQKTWNNDGKWRTTWDAADEAEGKYNKTDVRVGTGYANYKWCTERQVKDKMEGYDYPIIRYAEILLNYAEAMYELNGSITNEQLNESLNLVRKRSNPNMTPLSNELVNAHQEMTMLEEIRAERTVELFFEGFRIDDLKRWKTAETEMPGDLLGVKITGTDFATLWPKQDKPLNEDGCIIMFDGRQWEEKHYLLPLPADELQLNPELVQNPYWAK